MDKTTKYIGNRTLKVGGKYRIKEKLHFLPSKEWITLKSKSKVLAPSRTQTKKDLKKERFSRATSCKIQSLQFLNWSVLFVPTLLCSVHRKSLPGQSSRKRLISIRYFYLHCYIVTNSSTLCSNFPMCLQMLFNSTRILNPCQIFSMFIFCSVYFF